MLVFAREKLVILSVPKTGTTALQSALGDRADIVVRDPPELKHAPLYRYDRFFRPMFEKVCNARMETVAVMRAPVDWLGSWYRYRRRPFMSGKPNSTEGVSFDDFILACCAGERPPYADVGSQERFLRPRPDGEPVTHLFRYEEPERLADFLEDRIGVRPETKRENVSPVMNLSISAETEDRLRRRWSADFDLYDSIG